MLWCFLIGLKIVLPHYDEIVLVERKLIVIVIIIERSSSIRMTGRRPTCDRKTAKAPLLLQSLRLSYSCFWREYDWVQDEPIFESLDLSDHFGLIFC